MVLALGHWIAPLVLLASGEMTALPIEAIERGQRGECRTVFEGETVEPFAFEVKGVMRNYLGPQQDLVLVRLLGDKPEFTGVVSGMSGSPCSIGGKLVGALGYAFATFAKEPVAGITPIGSMRDVWALPEEERPWRLTPLSSMEALTPEALATVASPTSSDESMRPIAAPLAMAGVPAGIREVFSPWLRRLGFEPLAGGGAGSQQSTAETPKPTLVPGDAVAALLVRGDVEMAATGTVTTVQDGKVLAFGHPFQGLGTISMPMARATILNTMVSARRSFKMASPGPIVGEFTQDRLSAIAGVLGKAPAMIPVAGRLRTAQETKAFSFEVARDVSLSPRLLAMALASALTGRVESSQRGLLRLIARVEAPGLEPVVLRHVYADEADAKLFVRAALDVGRAVATLWDTPFGPPPDVKVDVDATYEPRPVVEVIESLALSSPLVEPGAALDVAVSLREVDGPSRVERFTLEIPVGWAGQAIEVVATDVRGMAVLEKRLGGDPLPNDLADVGRWLSARPVAGQLYLVALRAGVGVRSKVDVLPFLPPSAAALLLVDDPYKALRHEGMAWREARQRPGQVVGAQRTVLRIMPRRSASGGAT